MKNIYLLAWMMLFSIRASAQTPMLLEDLFQPEPHPFESLSGPIFNIQDHVMLTGYSLNLGYGMWALKNNQAVQISNSGSNISDYAATQDGFYFIEPYDQKKYTLYKHGGTPGVTFSIDDVQSNSQNNIPTIATLHGRVFYPDWDQAHGYELWSAKDSAGSGALVLDAYPGPGGLFPTELTGADSLVYYRGGGTIGSQLWRTNGTSSGTLKLLELNYQVQNIHAGSLQTLGNKAYFLVRTYAGNTALWISDGTIAGTKIAAEVPNASPAYGAFEAFFLNGKYCYLGEYQPNTSPVWIATDGTASGTEFLMDLPAITSYSYVSNNGATSKSILNGSFYFFYFNHNTIEYELWKSDGTSAGTEQVFRLGTASQPQALAATKSLFYFLSQDGLTDEVVLWSCDGTATGTKPVKSFGKNSNFSFAGQGAANDSLVVFQNPIYGPDLDDHPIRSDGTEAGTYPLAAIQATYRAGSDPTGFISGADGHVFFQASDQDFVTSIWKTEPEADFFISKLDTLVQPNYADPICLTIIGDKTLWFSEDTVLSVSDAGQTVSRIHLPVHFGSYWSKGPGEQIFFIADNGHSLWRSDGTLQGTYEVIPSPPNSNFYGLKKAGNALYFIQNIQLPNQSEYLWSSDGTATGTHSILPITSGSTLFLREVEGKLAFINADYMTQSCDLIVQGYPVIHLENYYDVDVKGLAIAAQKLFILGSQTYDSIVGQHYPFWVAENGQPVRLVKFKGLSSTALYNYGQENLLQSLKDKAIFGAGMREDDVELWTSDGTSNGTYEIRALNPSGSSNPDNFVRYNDQLWLFTANDGTEVAWWATNGTWDGTFKVASLATVKDYFVPIVNHAYLDNNRLYFSMTDGIIGQEPWVMVLEDSLKVGTLSPLGNENTLKIWPNPSSDLVNISIENQAGAPVFISITDAAGRTLFEGKEVFPESGPLSLRLPRQCAGVHIIRVVSADGKTRIQKLMIAD